MGRPMGRVRSIPMGSPNENPPAKPVRTCGSVTVRFAALCAIQWVQTALRAGGSSRAFGMTGWLE
jgi:hypothetical protein